MKSQECYEKFSEKKLIYIFFFFNYFLILNQKFFLVEKVQAPLRNSSSILGLSPQKNFLKSPTPTSFKILESLTPLRKIVVAKL